MKLFLARRATLIAILVVFPALVYSQNDASSSETDFTPHGIYEKTAPRAEKTEPRTTRLRLELKRGSRIALVGNTLLERSQHFGYFETALHQRFSDLNLVVRNLCWPADTPDLQPRPANFADLNQHLTHEKTDVVIAAFGFNESFDGQDGIDAFRTSLTSFVNDVRSRKYNGLTAPQVVLLSPIANENIAGVSAEKNNANIRLYAEVVKEVAAKNDVGFVDLFQPTAQLMDERDEPLTINGVHLNREGYSELARILFEGLFNDQPTTLNEAMRQVVVDKSRQFNRRYRPLNTFYYTGDRNRSYGYLDFLPAMRNFDMLVANRDQSIWSMANGDLLKAKIDDSNVPPLPRTKQSRGANRWMSAADELKEFKVDPRFEVNLFAGEEEFPEVAAPIQMRWDSRGRLWVACSTTYPHVYPGNKPNDKLVILEDTNGDGRADRSSVFADDLHIPLSFEFGDGGVYVSDEPHLTFIKDTDGDGKADFRRRLLTGFGTEDSHHSLHDFTWTPDGDLIFREGIFHHSQVETAYGPIRQRNSGWYRFTPSNQRLTSFGTYHSTNPWGVTFDDWGQHVASHPIYAAAFHATDPPYPQQHPKPTGLRAYSGTCGQEFVDFATFPDELRGHYIKARYKPTNRIEIHRWNEQPFGFDEEYVGDVIFSTNLSFIPVDVRFGPRGALYVCDWYNPIKGHAQYSLRDERRDRHSGRIWRITTKGKPLQEAPVIADASITELCDLLKRPEYRYRYWAKRELRGRDHEEVAATLDDWVKRLDRNNARFSHHLLEAIWAYRWIGDVRPDMLRELFTSEQPLARAATEQLRYWHKEMPDAIQLLQKAANDEGSIVRMQAAIAASHIGTREALDAMLDVTRHPSADHLAYAIATSLGSKSLRRHWKNNPKYRHVALLVSNRQNKEALREPRPNKQQKTFDRQKNLKTVKISCLPERMLYTVRKFRVQPGRPVKVVFSNPDATDHNLVFVRDGSLEAVGMAANNMARDPANANSDFIPSGMDDQILESSPMIGPTRKSRVHVLRFVAPKEPGIYPYVCTFPGHWVVMKGEMIVASSKEEADRLVADRRPSFVKDWTMADFPAPVPVANDERSIMRGMAAFIDARCHQCHNVGDNATTLGPDLSKISERFQGRKLLQHIVEPSAEINKDYQAVTFVLDTGKVVSGIITSETANDVTIVVNLLAPKQTMTIKKSAIDFREPSRVSSMPQGMLNSLAKEQILDLLAFLQNGGFQLPAYLEEICKPAVK